MRVVDWGPYNPNTLKIRLPERRTGSEQTQRRVSFKSENIQSLTKIKRCHIIKERNIDEKKVTDIKSFGNFFFLIRPKGKIMLAKTEKIIDKERETAEVSNTIFSNIVSNLSIVEYRNCRSSCSKVFCVKKVFLNFSQNSGKNSCFGASFS